MDLRSNIRKTDFPLLQVALDQTDVGEAIRVAKEAIYNYNGADWVEAGTPLIKSVGMAVIKEARKESPWITIAVEMLPMDAGRLELEMAFKAGADLAIITALAPISTIEECIQATQAFRKKVVLNINGLDGLVGKKKAQSMVRSIQQKYKDYLVELPKSAKIITSAELKRKGIEVVRKLKELFPSHGVIADLKAIHDVESELMAAFDAGADVACVVAAAGIEEMSKAVATARKIGRKVMADLIGISDYLGEDTFMQLTKEIEKIGVDFLCYHVPIDDQVRGIRIPPESVRRISSTLSIPVAVAGGINKNSAPYIVEAGAKILIVGGAITKARRPDKATQEIKEAMTGGPKYPILQMALDMPDVNKAIMTLKKQLLMLIGLR